MTASISLRPIGYVHGGRTEAVDDDWGSSRARIELDPKMFTSDALAGLGDFSHLEVIFLFDQVPADKIEYGARHRKRPASYVSVRALSDVGSTGWYFGASLCSRSHSSTA